MVYAVCNTFGIRAFPADTNLVALGRALHYDEYRFGIMTCGIDSRPSRFATSMFGIKETGILRSFWTGIDENLFDRSDKTYGADDTEEHPFYVRSVEARRKRSGKARQITKSVVVELVMGALERRDWPRTEAEIHLLRSAMFTAQAIIRDMERNGRVEEIEQISRNISEVAPELPR